MQFVKLLVIKIDLENKRVIGYDEGKNLLKNLELN